MRLIVSGSLGFTDYGLLKETMDELTKRLKEATVFVGAVRVNWTHTRSLLWGADELGEKWAKRWGHGVRVFQPTLNVKDLVEAHFARNARMVAGAEGLAVFHDGRCRLTKDLVRRGKRAGLKMKEVLV